VAPITHPPTEWPLRHTLPRGTLGVDVLLDIYSPPQLLTESAQRGHAVALVDSGPTSQGLGEFFEQPQLVRRLQPAHLAEQLVICELFHGGRSFRGHSPPAMAPPHTLSPPLS